MEYMFSKGFLGTKAPFFMDSVTLIVALLPILVGISIFLAKSKKYKMHGFSQVLLFITTLVVVFYFEYGVRVAGGFNAFMENSSVDYSYSLIVLIGHILISVVMLYLWAKTLFLGAINFKSYNLPGRYSIEHKKLAKKSFLFIVLSSLTGLWVYALLFIF